MRKTVKKLTSVLVALSLPLSGSVTVLGEEQNTFQADLEAKFVDPDMEYWPEARWWLAEGSNTDETIEETVQSAYDSGLGAVEFATLEAGVDAETYAWGSDEWISDSHKVIEEATSLGMGVSFTSGTHWKTANIPGLDPNSDAASQELAVTTQEVSDGETFDGVMAMPEAAENITSQRLVAVVAARVNSKDEETSYLDADSLVEITDSAEQTDEGCKLTYTAEDGDYVLFSYWQRGTGQYCTPSVETNYSINYFAIDGFNAFKEYWDENILTDEMKQLITDNGKVQMFMDSLELSHGGGFVYWTTQLREEFEQRKGYDIMPYMMLLMEGGWGAEAPYMLDGEEVLNEKYINDFDDVITQLYIDYLMQPMADYMHENGIELRAQIAYGQTLEASLPIQTLDYVESESLNGNDQPEFYRYQAGAQHLYDINEFSSETGATWVNYAWSLRHILEYPVYTAFLGGVNRIIYHGMSSIWGPEGTSWPGYEGMYGGISERMDERQPFYQDLKAFNTHLARIQEALRYGQAQMDVGILTLDYNMNSAYGQQISHLLEHEGFYWPDVNMQDAGYTYEYFNPQILTQEDITAENGEVDPDGVSYQALIVWQDSLPADVAQKLIEYAKAGVRILILDGAAQYTPWNDGLDEELAAAMEELRTYDTVTTIATEADAAAALAELGVQPRTAFEEPNEALLTVFRADEDVAYMFVNNYTQATETTAEENADLAEGEPYMRHYDDSTAVSIDTTISVEGSYVPYLIDTWSGEATRVADYTIENGRTIIPVSLDSGDTALYAFEPAENDENKTIVATTADETTTVDGQLAVRALATGNYETTLSDGTVVTSDLVVNDAISLTDADWHLTVEDWQPGELLTRTEEKEDYTTTEYTYSTSKDTIDVDLSGLKTWNNIEEVGLDVSGVGYYSTTFILPEGFVAENGAYLDLGSLESSAKVTINGQETEDVNLDRPRVDVSDLLVDGENTIEIRISTTLTNRMLSLGLQQAGVANLGMDFPLYINGYFEYGLTTVDLVPYAQAIVE
jgi:hypothetical protein